MDTTGWYITEAVAPLGTTDAGAPAWVVMFNGVWQQGFPYTDEGLLDAKGWGFLNGKGDLPVRTDPEEETRCYVPPA